MTKVLTIALVLLVLAGGGYYFYSKASAPDAGLSGEWETYQSLPGEEELAESGQALGWSINYPVEWEYLEMDLSLSPEEELRPISFVAFSDQPAGMITRTQYRVAVQAYPLGLEGYLAEAVSAAEKTEFSLGGQEAVRYSEGEESVVAVQSPFYFTVVLRGQEADEAVLNRMAETLVFTQY